MKIKLWNSNYFIPFPKKVRFLTAFWWWFHALIKPYTRKRKWLKYCTECGWPLIRIDDLYDVGYMETIHPEAIQMCSFCGIEYKRYKSSGFLGTDKFIVQINKFT